jgi:hypothetical protein
LAIRNNNPLKKILIISPHFPPSNLAAVHRSRLFAQHLPSFGWQPTVLMVDEKYYEEKLDWNLHKLLPTDLKVEKCNAFNVTKPRLIGDIGLRAFFQLYKKAKQIIEQDSIDFLYIPIPSFYVALLGRWLHKSTGVKYGIDYIDPWVHHFPGSNKIFSRHWFSTKIAKFLEPIAVKKASIITGVAEGYYRGVIERNHHLKNTCKFAAMPYGGEIRDHEMLNKIGVEPYLFTKKNNTIQLMYAGAFLPKSVEPLKRVFKAIAANKTLYSNVIINFIGTGRVVNGIEQHTIKPIAEEFGLYNTIIKEYPKRIPYLDVLTHLNIVDGVFILGSTEPHYTPSKSYQAVLSHKPIFAVLHQASTAVGVLQKSNAGIVLAFNGEQGLHDIETKWNETFANWLHFKNTFNAQNVDMNEFNKFSAKEVTKILAEVLDKIN